MSSLKASVMGIYHSLTSSSSSMLTVSNNTARTSIALLENDYVPPQMFGVDADGLQAFRSGVHMYGIRPSRMQRTPIDDHSSESRGHMRQWRAEMRRLRSGPTDRTFVDLRSRSEKQVILSRPRLTRSSDSIYRVGRNDHLSTTRYSSFDGRRQ